MKKVIFSISLFILFSCSQKIVKQPENNDKLTQFFINFENDLKRTSKVIQEKELVNILTHLHRMGSGGKHYYPLERKALTKMIRSLSTYNYAECILFNRRGTIIYSMVNDDLFSKNARRIVIPPFNNIFTQTMKSGLHIEDISYYHPYSDYKLLYFAIAIKEKDKPIGVLTAAVSTELLLKNIPNKSNIIDKNGVFRFNEDETKFLKFDSNYINSNFINENKIKFRIKNNSDIFSYKAFKYENISWFLINKN